jgi:hypothetical protein
VCPWLGYEVNVATGRHQDNPLHAVQPFKIAVLDGDIVVTLPEGTREPMRRAGIWIKRIVRGTFRIRRGRATGATQAALSGGKR